VKDATAGPEREAILKAARRHKAIADAPVTNGAAPQDSRPVLALLCYEGPEGPVGQYVHGLAATLSKRQTAVHLFARKAFPLDGAGVSVHVVGESDGALLDQVQEFTNRATKAFLQVFKASPARVTLMGCEWSTVGALSSLRGERRLETLLSLHSLERLRGGLGSDISRRIDEVERTGLREAKAVLVHDARAADAAKATLPDCTDRLLSVPTVIDRAAFDTGVDPGAIKARYQVGPIDPTILCIGDLSERYGPDLVVKALPAVLRNHKQARVIAVGEGALYWPLKVYARYLLIEHAVRLPGSVVGQAMNELVQAADVVVLPSRDTTPWWPFQAAWAAGRPVVATHKAAPGMFEHERDAVLVYPSENSIVWGIERVLYDEGLRRSLAEHGRVKLEERFGWTAIADQVEDLMGVAHAR
jgi:glycosyltransferase involved in cell wall biosynthesis